MKVNSAASQKKPETPKKMSKEDVQKRLAAKFGKKIGVPKEKVEISKNAKSADSTKIINKEDVIIGDIAKNDPKSETTQEKLKSILVNGGFDFNEKERKTLSKILKP